MVLNLKYPRNRLYYQNQIEKIHRQVKILGVHEALWIYMISGEVSNSRMAHQVYFLWTSNLELLRQKAMK